MLPTPLVAEFRWASVVTFLMMLEQLYEVSPVGLVEPLLTVGQFVVDSKAKKYWKW